MSKYIHVTPSTPNIIRKGRRMRIGAGIKLDPSAVAMGRGADSARVEAKPGRNDPCPCGSAAKFKRCCGAP